MKPSFFLQTQFPWIRTLEAVATVECPECTNVDPIQVTFYNETLLNSSWILHGLNLLIYQANLSQTDFTIDRVSGQIRDGVISIYNSTVGSVNVQGTETFRINVTKSDLDGTERPEKTLLDVVNTKLYIKKSTFRSNKVEAGPALVKALNSRIAVENSSFLENVAQTGLFQIANGSNLNVTDSEFEALEELGSLVLWSMNNVKATFTRCIFNRTAGFYASQNTSMTVKESLITDSQYLDQGSTTLIQLGSHIQFINTTIVNNMTPLPQPFLSVSIGSSVAMTNCAYANNARQRHVLIQKDSSLEIVNSQFFDNTGNHGSLPTESIHLFEIQDSKVSITGGNFHNNSFQNETEVYASFLFHMTNSEAKFFKSKFIGNTADHILFTESQYSSPQKYIAIEHCTFDNHKGEITISNIANVVFEKSHLYIGNNSWISDAIVLSQPKTVRIAFSLFFSLKEAHLLRFQRKGWKKRTAELKTLNTTFRNRNHILKSDSENFLEEARELGFIHIGAGVNVNVVENQYASSKYIHFCFLLSSNNSGGTILDTSPIFMQFSGNCDRIIGWRHPFGTPSPPGNPPLNKVRRVEPLNFPLM